jgi:hypothetical protein
MKRPAGDFLATQGGLWLPLSRPAVIPTRYGQEQTASRAEESNLMSTLAFALRGDSQKYPPALGGSQLVSAFL